MSDTDRFERLHLRMDADIDHGYVPQETLYAIQARDPDGGERQPTEADYRSFEDWARRTYGDAAWNTYRRGGWAQDRSEGDWSHHGDAYDYDDGGW